MGRSTTECLSSFTQSLPHFFSNTKQGGAAPAAAAAAKAPEPEPEPEEEEEDMGFDLFG